LPGGVDFISATATQGTCDRQGNTVTCALGDIADGATVTVTLKVRPKKKSGTIENTASVESSVQDSKPANDEDTESTTIREAAPGPTCKGKTATIVGTSGDDRGATALVGTSGRDVIAGLSGNDEIKGLNGKDLACGGPGNDVIKGGAKGDKLAGGGGRDKVNGGAGGDNIGGQGGGDKLIGRGGSDTIRGHRGKDVLKGNGGSDLLVGGPQRDKCSGGPGKDELRSC
jgi:Ca2+-binding RTX toxin-like protein